MTDRDLKPKPSEQIERPVNADRHPGNRTKQ